MKPELLAPAGNMEKLKAALLYGADAAYLAYNRFGMRAAADNFTMEELAEAVTMAHGMGKKIYLTLNTLPHEDEYPALREFLTELGKLPSGGVDAAIVADVGVMELIREVLPHLAIHVSTQAGTVSSADAKLWKKLGASRVVLARELSLAEIREIRRNLPEDVEIEAFVHGSMCVSFSGRCLLSNHLCGRDANRGMCAQPCRWNYTITEEKRSDMPMPIEQTELGTFIMASKDMNMIAHVPELIEAGISSFKIEGRMKSAYYTAVVTNAYRAAIDGFLKDGDAYVLDPRWEQELDSVSHREYCTGFYFDDPMENPQLATTSGYLREKAYLAVALDYDEKTGLALFRQRNKVSRGDAVELISPGQFGRAFAAEKMIAAESGEEVESAPHPFMEFWLPVPFPVHKGDILRGGSRT